MGRNDVFISMLYKGHRAMYLTCSVLYESLGCMDMSRSACLDSLCPELLSDLIAGFYRPAGQNYSRPCRRQGFHSLDAQPTVPSSY